MDLHDLSRSREGVRASELRGLHDGLQQRHGDVITNNNDVTADDNKQHSDDDVLDVEPSTPQLLLSAALPVCLRGDHRAGCLPPADPAL